MRRIRPLISGAGLSRREGSSGRLLLLAVFALGLSQGAVAQLAGLTSPISSGELSATASSPLVSFPPGAAVDGYTSTFMAMTAPLSNEWIQVDLGYGRRVAGVDIYSTRHRPREYALYTSDEPDPADWGEPLATGELPDTTAYHSIPLGLAYARYLRLAILSRWSTYTYVHEIRVHESSFKLADKQTGHRGHTNSNTVDVVSLPVMIGYDAYRITDSATEPAGGWLPYDPAEPPADLEVLLGTPAEGEPVTRYAWFKDPPWGFRPTTNAPASIRYVRAGADVEALAVPNLVVPGWGEAYPAVVRLAEVNAGSGSSIGLHRLFLGVDPDVDQTPEDPHRITLPDAGSYTVTLTATDMAGNTDTATTGVIVVAGETGQTATWTGGGDGSNWFDTNNWSSLHFPGPGAAVTIVDFANVALKDSTAPLASFAISNNATLTFTNWNTTLTAETVTVGPQGTLTCAGPFRDGEMSNNVAIACGHFTLHRDGMIDLDGKGYAGAAGYEPRGHGPGASVSSENNGGGAGHGGQGGEGGFSSIAPLAGGPAYGDPPAPVYAGSGGGAGTGSSAAGAEGGGALKLTVSGPGVLDGTISANGLRRTTRGGCGSGGSVWLRCGTLAGSNGIVRAEGGEWRISSQSGGGGGGRVAVIVTDPETQALLSKPDLIFSARRGQTRNYKDGELGTLYFENLDLIDPARYRHSGRLIVPDFAAWSPDILGIERAAVQFSTNAFDLTVSGRLTVSGDDAVLFTQPGGTLRVGGDLILSNSATVSLPAETDGPSTVAVGGDLVLADSLIPAGGSSLWIECRVTNQPPDTTSFHLNVGGDIHVGAFSWIHLFSDPLSGGSALFRSENVFVSAEGGFNADGGGFSNVGKGPGKGLFTGGLNFSGPWGGGGYGGLGGFGTLGGSGTPYGPEETPMFPGSAGAIRFPATYGLKPEGRSIAFKNGHGGGLIRIEAENRVTVDGVLTANGGDAQRGGGGSGGAISIRCKWFEGIAGAVLRADGGSYVDGNVRDIAGGGGAGRIAIWRMFDSYQGEYSLLGGASTYPDEAAPGSPGTVFLGQIPTTGTMILLH